MSDPTTRLPRHGAATTDPSDTENPTSEFPPIDDATRTYEPANEPEPPGVRHQASPIPARIRTSSWWTASTAVWAGLVLVAAGFTAIFYTWSNIAGLVSVAQQLPYLASGELAGLALVIVGVTVIDVAVRRQDSHERHQQLTQINRVLTELHDSLDTEPAPHPDGTGTPS